MKQELELVKSIGSLILIALFLKGSVIDAYKIPSSSMKPTIIDGDHILVNKLSYGLRLPFINDTLYNYSKPNRGDIVVFSRVDNPATEEDESSINIIKRVVAIEGDTVEVEGINFKLNDINQDEDYAIWLEGGILPFAKQEVPEDTVFLMGDNRDHSKDSRAWRHTQFLPIRRVKGRAFIIYWNKGFIWNRFFKILK